MCNPAVIPLIAMGVSAVAGAVGKKKEGDSAANAAKANAAAAYEQSNDALIRGADEETRYRRSIAQLASSQKAAFGARNVAVKGTPQQLLDDTAYWGEVDAQQIRQNAGKASRAYAKQGGLYEKAGRNAKSMGGLGFGGTLLTGAAQAYGSFKGMG